MQTDARPGRPLGRVEVGRWSPEHLRRRLHEDGVLLNEYAEQLLARDEMQLAAPVDLPLVGVAVGALGLARGGTLPAVVDAAAAHGLHPCPMATGAYLRLRHREQASTDPELRRHRPPDGALHVASVLDGLDALGARGGEAPRGLYLRTVDGRRWLRGYRCDDEYVIEPTVTYVFTTTSWNPAG